MSKEYIRLSQRLQDKYYQMIPANESPYKYIKNKKEPQFISMIKYDENTYSEWQKTGTLAGVSGGKTNKIWVDFDNEENPSEAFKDAKDCVMDLLDLGITEDCIQISFSGNKGIGIIVDTSYNEYTNEQVKSFCFTKWKHLPTFDDSMYDHQRIFRLNYTVNEKSGLYKIPITFEELKEANVENVKELAKIEPVQQEIEDARNYYKVSDFKIPEEYLNVTKLEPVREISPANYNTEIDWSIKPKFMSNCRWALQNGMFKPGFRSEPLLCLASTYKNLGYSQNITYRMLKGVAQTESERNGSERYSDKELYNNIILQVFSDRWKNGQFTCKEPGNFLYDYCLTLGKHSCKHDKKNVEPRQLTDITPHFKEYVKNIDKNTILTGIPSIDKNVFISTGANVGIIGAAGSGKTSLALDILNNTSKAGVKSVFASLDMVQNRMYEKVMYRLTGLSRQDLYKVFQDDNEQKFLDRLKEEFGNVYFFGKSMPTVQDLREYILDLQDQTGEKIKLVMVDYFERIMSDMSDDTAASKRIAGELQDMVNDLDIALVTLVQPNKFSIQGGPDKPIWNYTAIKGSSYLYQSFRIILSLWRPFYTPEDFSNDHYMQMAVLKNDLGELNNFVFNWSGKRGMISEMEDFQKDEFYRLLKEKDNKNDKEDGGGWQG